ncbi:MAG: hypothetical protein LBG96_07645 [Tannerella sp.]|jgi:hypothetical protein|nr:hypothetical protein [Tannerella sp.]
MTGGSIAGCETSVGRGTVYVSGTSSNVNLARVKINDNTARYGGAIYVNTGGRITLDSDTIFKNTTTAESYTNPVTGTIHLAGTATGRLSLRDRCSIEDGIFYINSTRDSIYVDEALLSSSVGAFRLLGNSSVSPPVTNPGTVVVSPNGTTITDASQFLSKFTLMNQDIGRGLDKGGTENKHIMIVNQFFIDGTVADGGNGSNPLRAFNKITQLTPAIFQPYTTVWVSGPVAITGNNTMPVITNNNVNLRRYTGFAVAAQLFPAYDSVMFTINQGASLTIQGGNSAANNFTISGEGGSGYYDASIFKNNGTLTLGGYTTLYFNPTAGRGAAIYQNGTLNMSGTVQFDLYSTNTVYLPENKVINITGPLNTTTPIGLTVETSPVNTHLPGRVVVTGTATNIPVGTESIFYNEIPAAPLPIGRTESGATANLMFYLADRNVTGVPIYTTLQGAIDAAISANDDEVRLYGNTDETIFVDKTFKYNSKGHSILNSFTLDSTANVQLLDDFIADTLFIRATTFSNKAQIDLDGYDANIAKAAYFYLMLPQGAAIGEWYPVNLPFNADIADIRNADDTAALILYMQDYAIAEYHGQKRATFGIGNQPSNPDNDWQYFTDNTLHNGTGYMVTTAGATRTFRFKAADLNLFATTTTPITFFAGPAESAHHGINYIPQTRPANSIISWDVPTGAIIQVSESLSSDRIGAASYVAKSVTPSLIVAPYTNYFYQTTANSTINYTRYSAPATVKSGKIPAAEYPAEATSSGAPAYYELRFYAEDPERHDALFVAASEYASKDRYEIGRDVVKMGTTGHAAQIWSKDFDIALCANEARLEDGMADIPMMIHTPVKGMDYRLKLHNVVNYREQLWLCRNGKLVQNLSEYPEYTIKGTGDTTGEFSLRLLTNTTANDKVATGEVFVYTENKTIVIAGLQPEDKYLVFDMAGRLFHSGKATGDRTRIHAGSGIYVIQLSNKKYKAIVK